MRILIILLLLLPVINVFSQTTREVEDKLKELDISLPEMSVPVASYVKYVQTGNLIFLAGHGPCGGEFKRGKVGRDLTVEEGYSAARLTGVCMLATLKHAIGGEWSRVKRIVKVTGMVQCTDDFENQPEVVNGFSDLMVEVFGERGKHARAAVGMVALPRNIPIEVEMIVEVE